MNYQLDEIDKKILDFLVENTRMPFTEIAKQMDVSAGTIHVRVKKMEDAGIILGSSLIIDYSKLDYHFTNKIQQNTRCIERTSRDTKCYRSFRNLW
jgi:Lrp/AsnC family transcriptional regulator for asnA, asnC and gidA